MKKLLLILCLLPSLAFAGPAADNKEANKPNAPVDAQRFLKLRNSLIAQGCTTAQAGQAIGAAASGKTNKAIADQLKAWCKGLPKK